MFGEYLPLADVTAGFVFSYKYFSYTHLSTFKSFVKLYKGKSINFFFFQNVISYGV